MPCVTISSGKWAEGREMAIIEAVQAALVAAFKILETDRDVVLNLYDNSRRIISSGRSERFTRVEIVGIAARSMEAKRALYRAIVDNLSRVGVPVMETRIVLIEPPSTNWGVKGGIPASEADLGFKIEV
jgi:phenylpyruvate tautomerase PptA (4-oxalocrotonate tautomerase family)